MEEKKKETPFRPLSIEEQKRVMAENAQLKIANRNMLDAIQNYQTGFAMKRVDWLFEIVENKGLAFDSDIIVKAAKELIGFVWPSDNQEETEETEKTEETAE